MGETNGIYYALQIKIISIIHWKILTKTLAHILFLMLIYFHSNAAVSHGYVLIADKNRTFFSPLPTLSIC